MKEAENLLQWLTTPPKGAKTTSQPPPPPPLSAVKVFRNILDESSVHTATTVETCLDFDEEEHSLHPRHVPTPQSMREIDLSEVQAATTSILEGAFGGIQQSLQSLLEKGNGDELTLKKSNVYPSPITPPESPRRSKNNHNTSQSVLPTSSIDGMSPIRMGPDFWKNKATPQKLGDGSRHERERFNCKLNIPNSPVSPANSSVRSITSNGVEVTELDFESFLDIMEARDDDNSLFGSPSSSPSRKRSAHTTSSITANNKIVNTPPLQRQWMNDHSLNLHQACRSSIRLLDDDIIPIRRTLEGFGSDIGSME